MLSFGLLFLYISQYQDELTSTAIESLNNELNTPIVINGESHLNFFQGFPNIALHLHEVSIGSLFKGKSLYLLIPIHEVIMKKYKIKKIIIEDAHFEVINNPPDIINYNRQPVFTPKSGKNAQLIPVIGIDGKLQEVIVLNAGSEYNSPPELTVNGDGKGTVLVPILKSGTIDSVVAVSYTHLRAHETREDLVWRVVR